MAASLKVSLPSRNTLLFIALCILWYSTSFLSASTSKALLSPRKVKRPEQLVASNLQDASTGTANLAMIKSPPLFPYPVSLTALQFFFVFTFSYLLSSPTIAGLCYTRLGLALPRDHVTGRPRGLMGTLVMVDGAKLREMVGLSVFNVTGHAMTSAAIQMVPVSTVHTVKALSPLFTVLTYVFILGLSYPLRTYFSLLPLTLGVIFACSGLSSIEGPNVGAGLALSVGSTIVFVAQNLWSKKLLGHALAGGSSSSERRPSRGNELVVKLDKLNILFWSSGVSCVLMLPVLFFSDLPRMMAARSSRIDLSSQSTGGAIASGWDHADPALAPTSPDGAAAPSQTLRILSLLLSNGTVHFSQNLLAFSVLGLTSPVTYSIASLFKRVFVICFAILWFGQTVTSLQWVGILLTFLGLYLYNDSKNRTGSLQSSGSSSRSAAGKDGTEALLGGERSMASREDEAAVDFGMDKGSRRRAGLLPTNGGLGNIPSGNGGIEMFGLGSASNGRGEAPPRPLAPPSSAPFSSSSSSSTSSGPIWKGMTSSTALYGGGGSGNPNGSTTMESPSRMVSINIHPNGNINGNGLGNGHGHAIHSMNGHTRPHLHDVKDGPKQD